MLLKHSEKTRKETKIESYSPENFRDHRTQILTKTTTAHGAACVYGMPLLSPVLHCQARERKSQTF